MDRISNAEILTHKAKPVAEKTLNEVLVSSYGIFSGKADKRAVLRFTPKQARWVASEQWHPQQLTRYDKDGSYLLEFPYSNDGELVMDILRYGPDVEVVSPAPLREKVKQHLADAIARYT